MTTPTSHTILELQGPSTMKSHLVVGLLIATVLLGACADDSETAAPAPTQPFEETASYCIGFGMTIEIIMESCRRQVDSATGRRAIKLAREDILNAEQALDEFENLAAPHKDNERVQSYLDAVPGYRSDLAAYRATLDQRSR